MALAALWIIVQRAPNGETKQRSKARETLHNLESKMDTHQTRVEDMMARHIEAGDASLKVIDGKIDTLNGHMIDHYRDHANR